jgi:hypothetical protein
MLIITIARLDRDVAERQRTSSAGAFLGISPDPQITHAVALSLLVLNSSRAASGKIKLLSSHLSTRTITYAVQYLRNDKEPT